MPVSFEVSKTFRLSGDDNRHLHEIMDAVGLKEADALRFALQVSTILLQYVVENDPKAVFIEHQHGRGRIVLPEKMSDEEKEAALQYVREQVGPTKFDKLMQNGREQQAFLKRDHEIFLSARDALLATSQAPFTFDQIALAIQKTGKCSLPWAKKILDRQWRNGNQLVQVSPGKYNFVTTLEQKERPSA
jgi:hypothetical protein